MEVSIGHGSAVVAPPAPGLPGREPNPCTRASARGERHPPWAGFRRPRLVVEIDSFLYHQGSIAFQDDHARDLDLRQLGVKVLRYSELQLEAEPDRVVADVIAALGR